MAGMTQNEMVDFELEQRRRSAKGRLSYGPFRVTYECDVWQVKAGEVTLARVGSFSRAEPVAMGYYAAWVAAGGDKLVSACQAAVVVINDLEPQCGTLNQLRAALAGHESK